MIACNTSGQWQEALGVYRAMLAAGHQPNTTTFNALISAYSKAGRLDRVMEAFQEMVNTGCERSVITYSSLISACEKAGRWVTVAGRAVAAAGSCCAGRIVVDGRTETSYHQLPPVQTQPEWLCWMQATASSMEPIRMYTAGAGSGQAGQTLNPL
jgi:pentatricopeptide repeat protein